MFRYAHVGKAVVLGLALCSPIARAADVVETARREGSLGTFVRALDAAGLAETLKGKGPFTVFAPTDEAFGELPQEVADRLLAAENKEQLRAVLGYHVVQGQAIAPGGAQTKTLLETMEGDDLAVGAAEGGMVVSPAAADYAGASGVTEKGVAREVKAGIKADNGVVHVIDAVLLPPRVQKELPQKREQ